MHPNRQITMLLAVMPVMVQNIQDKVAYTSRLPRTRVWNVLTGPLPLRVPACSASRPLPILNIISRVARVLSRVMTTTNVA